jgi:hypothetical protein
MAATEHDAELGVEFLGASLRGILFGWQVGLQARTSKLDVIEATLDRGLRWVRGRSELENEAFLLQEYAEAVPLCFGESPRALALARQTMVLAEELASPLLKLNGLRCLACSLLNSGDPDSVLELVREHRELSEDFGIDLQFVPLGLALQAEAQCELGRFDDGLASALDAVASAQRMSAGLLLPDILHALTIAHLKRAEFEDANRAIDRMETAARETGAVNHLPRCQWRRGQVMGARGDADGHERLLREALGGFEERGAAGYARRVADELGIESGSS